MDKDRKFVKGDRVRIISKCDSYSQIGVILNYLYPSQYPRYYKQTNNYVRVKLDNGDIKKYNENSLLYIGHQEIILEDEDMAFGNEVQGNYNVAMVRFIQGMNTSKHYAFAMFEPEIGSVAIGDKVLCDTANGYNVAEVVEIMSKNAYSEAHSTVVTKEIICKVDFSAFNNRITVRRERQSLKAQMDKLVQENHDLILYQAIADKNPDMAVLLAQYKALGNV